MQNSTLSHELEREIAHISQQIKSRERVRDHGEVFTNEREVKHMVALLGDEAERIEARILEPACGTGNFFIELLERKLATVEKHAQGNPEKYALYALIALGALYGIDIQKDNIEECHTRLKKILLEHYKRQNFHEVNFKNYLIISTYILEKNIIWGDTLKMCRLPNHHDLITFSEWRVENKKIKRKIFKYKEKEGQEDLFNTTPKEYDLSSEPILIKEFPALSLDEMAEFILKEKSLNHV